MNINKSVINYWRQRYYQSNQENYFLKSEIARLMQELETLKNKEIKEKIDNSKNSFSNQIENEKEFVFTL